MKRLFYLLAVVISTGLISCSEDETVGPAGPRGEQGESGVDGATVLNGDSDPTSEDGGVGDFYINTNSYVMFGPKTSTGWGNGESILGEKGDKGEADYVLLSGTAVPTSSIGKYKDFYYRTTTRTLFYRAGTGWQEIASLANTIQFTKTGVSLTGTNSTLTINLPGDVLVSSMVHVYAQPSPFGGAVWYSLPGYVTRTSTNTESYFQIRLSRDAINPYRSRISFYRISGTTSFSDVTIRILVTEAKEFETVAKHVDFNNYNEVSQYFKLKN